MRFFTGEQHIDTVRGESMMSRAEAIAAGTKRRGVSAREEWCPTRPTRDWTAGPGRHPNDLKLLGWRRLGDWAQPDGSLTVVLPGDGEQPLRLSLDELAGFDPDTTLIRASMHSVPLWRFEGGEDPFASSEQRWLRLVQG